MFRNETKQKIVWTFREIFLFYDYFYIHIRVGWLLIFLIILHFELINFFSKGECPSILKYFQYIECILLLSFSQFDCRKYSSSPLCNKHPVHFSLNYHVLYHILRPWGSTWCTFLKSCKNSDCFCFNFKFIEEKIRVVIRSEKLKIIKLTASVKVVL